MFLFDIRPTTTAEIMLIGKISSLVINLVPALLIQLNSLYKNYKFYFLIYVGYNFENKMSAPIITQVATPYRMAGLNKYIAAAARGTRTL